MARKPKTLTYSPSQCWPKNAHGTTLYVGDVLVKFTRTKHGKRVSVTSYRRKPRRKVIDKRGG